MWFKHRAWIPVAWVLSGANLVSVWFAAQPGEPWHASAHALLAVLFALGARRLEQRKRPSADPDVVERLLEMEERLAELDVERRLGELEERVDFTERAMVDVRTRAQLPPKE